MALRTFPAGRHRGPVAAGPLLPRVPGGSHRRGSTPPSPGPAGAAGADDAAARLPGLDLARGLAVVLLAVALLAPAPGLRGLADALAAPLLAVVIGVSTGVRLRLRRPPVVTVLLDGILRGLGLVALGVGLQLLGDQVDVILPALGLLLVVLAPLALALHRAPLLTLGLALALAVLGPLVTERVDDARAAGAQAVGAAQVALLDWTVAADHYRLVSLLPMALGGLALAVAVPRAGERPVGYGVAAVLLGSGLAVRVLGQASDAGVAPSSGSTAEVTSASLLAGGVVVLALLVAGPAAAAASGITPLLATGRLALTGYALMVLLLAAVPRTPGGAPEPGWLPLAGVLVAVVAACWAIERRWGTGPLEWLAHRARLPARRGAGSRGVSARSGGSR